MDRRGLFLGHTKTLRHKDGRGETVGNSGALRAESGLEFDALFDFGRVAQDGADGDLSHLLAAWKTVVTMPSRPPKIRPNNPNMGVRAGNDLNPSAYAIAESSL
jgi:hypothetical protein